MPVSVPLQAKPAAPVFNAGDLLAFGIVAAYPCVSITGGVTTPDVTPFNNPANIVGGVSVFADGILGNVLQLDGTSGYLTLNAVINSALNGQSAASVSFWLRLRNNVAASNAKAGLADLGGLSGPTAATLWAAPGNVADMAIFRALTRVLNISLGGSLPFPTAGIVDKTQWHLVTVTNVNGGFYTVWLDGNIIFQNTSEGPVSALIAPTVGRSSDGSGLYYLDGWLGDIRIWNRELQLYEVRSQVNNPWGLYLPGPPQGQMNSLETELAASIAGFGQGRVRAVSGERAARLNPTFGLRSLLSEAATHPSAFAAYQQGIDPRIKPTVPVLNADPITTGLVLALPFYEGAGLTAHDKSGNGFDATQVGGGAGWTTGAFRTGAFSFSAFQGNNALFAPAGFPASAVPRYFDVPRQAALEPAAFTIAAWVRPTFNQSSKGIISKRTLLGPGGSDYSYFLGTSPAGNAFQGRLTDNIDDPNFIVGSARTFDGTRVYHVAFSYDPAELPASIMRLYVNGVLDASLPDLGTIVYDATQSIRIGDDGSGTRVFDGAIDLATIWNRKLSDAEIRALAGGPESDTGLNGGLGLFAVGGLTSGVLVEAAALPYPSNGGLRTVSVEVAAKLERHGGGVARSVLVEAAAIAAAQNLAGLMIAGISPAQGPQNGGTAVTIKGVHFENITAVLLGGNALTSLVVVDPYTITGVAPAHSPGLVDLEVDSSTRSYAIAKNAFQYTGSASGPSGYIRGKQLDVRLPRQERFTGITAVQGVDTVLAPLTLSDIPQGIGSVQVFLDKSGTGAGGKFMRQGVDYTPILAPTGGIMWRSTAPVGIAPTDIITVKFLAQGNTA